MLITDTRTEAQKTITVSNRRAILAADFDNSTHNLSTAAMHWAQASDGSNRAIERQALKALKEASLAHQAAAFTLATFEMNNASVV